MASFSTVFVSKGRVFNVYNQPAGQEKKEEAPKVKSKKHSGNEESKGSKEEAKEAEA